MKTSKNERVATAAAIVMSSIIISRITGYIREAMLSWKVGLGWVQDAYVAAFQVPDLMYVLLVGGTISAAFIPVLSDYLERDDEEEGWKATSSFITMIFIGMIIICLLGVIFAPYIISVAAVGFAQKSTETRELAVSLCRILFPSVGFIMLAGLCNGVLNSYRRFAAAAYGPTIYNIGCGISIFLFADKNQQSMEKVATGVLCSAALYFLFQLSFAIKNLKYFRPGINFVHPGFRKLVKQAIPSLLSSSVVQINVIVSTSFVSLTAYGGISAFRNANTAWLVPYGIFAVGIGTAMLPTLSRQYASGKLEEYKELLMKSLRSVLFLSIPSAAGIIVLREPIVRALFKGGKFTEDDVPIVAVILMMFSAALISQSIVSTMNRGFYARQDTKTPLFIGAGTILLNFGFGYLFYKTTTLGASGMALSYSIISTINAVLLMMLLNKKAGGLHIRSFLIFFAKSAAASVAMCIAVSLIELIPVSSNTKISQLLYLLFVIGAGSIVYFIVMLLLKSQDARAFTNALKARIKRFSGTTTGT